MSTSRRLLDFYIPPEDDLSLESVVTSTYKIDWEFVEEELLASALGVRSPVSRMSAFRTELERRLDSCDVTILYDLRASDRLARLSPRIDPLPLMRRKLHAKITILLWSGQQVGSGTVRKRARLIVGSANLTRQGFRENYEVVSSVDFGGRGSASRELLLAAVDLLSDMAKETISKRLDDQLSVFRQFARGLVESEAAADQPWRFVTADNAVAVLEEAWRGLGEDSPQAVIVVSPFWPEGERPWEPVAALVQRFGVPGRLELICESVLDVKGKSFLPLLPRGIPIGLRSSLACPVFIRQSTGSYDVGEDQAGVDSGELTEDLRLAVEVNTVTAQRRALHAKVIVVRGKHGSALYIGSSNCTRRGLALPGAATMANWEAGFVYRLTRGRAAIVEQLLGFAGPAIEVPAGGDLVTKEPEREPEPSVPIFLHEVVASGTRISIRFREGKPVPADVIILMRDRANPEHHFVLLQGAKVDSTTNTFVVALEDCPRVDEALSGVHPEEHAVTPGNVWASVEVRWGDHIAQFPVRFDDRTSLPPVQGMRQLTEGEIIEYFVSGREPWEPEPPDGDPRPKMPGPEEETTPPVDTRGILSYFVRHFVEAIPGIEAEVQRAMHSKPALEASLFGPTSPVVLAKRALESLRVGPASREPKKTSVSVAFQLVEIIAALRRCREKATSTESKEVLRRGIKQCEEILKNLVMEYGELRSGIFRDYRRLFSGDA